MSSKKPAKKAPAKKKAAPKKKPAAKKTVPVRKSAETKELPVVKFEPLVAPQVKLSFWDKVERWITGQK